MFYCITIFDRETLLKDITFEDVSELNKWRKRNPDRYIVESRIHEFQPGKNWSDCWRDYPIN